MTGFARRAPHYAFTDAAGVQVIAIAEIEPFTRTLNLQGFSRDGFNQDRMISILSAFVTGAPLPPVEVTENASGTSRYALYNGMHRFYASIAAGFSDLPVIVVVNDLKAFREAEDAEIEAWSRSQGKPR